MKPRERINIASSKENIVEVENFVQDIFDFYRIERDFFGNIILATTEAFENSVVHGNKNNTSKFVSLFYEYNPEKLIIEVKDEGDGFSESDINDPTLSDNDKKGLFLIKMLSDNVAFHEDEAMVSMSFKVNCIHSDEYHRRIKLLNIYFNKVTQKVENE